MARHSTCLGVSVISRIDTHDRRETAAGLQQKSPMRYDSIANFGVDKWTSSRLRGGNSRFSIRAVFFAEKSHFSKSDFGRPISGRSISPIPISPWLISQMAFI